MISASDNTLDHLLVVGTNSRTASPSLRERLFLNEPEPIANLEKLRRIGPAEGMVIATCERLDFVALPGSSGDILGPLQELLAECAREDTAAMRQQSYQHRGEAAVRHLFAVAASLDSQVIGEPQVLGQVKECHRVAAGAGMTGPVLEPLLQAAYGAAKCVRRETPVAEHSVSMASSALQVARTIHGDLKRCDVLMLGTGEMGELLAGEFDEAGVAGLVVMHEFESRAEAVAHRLAAHYRPWGEISDALWEADIVICDRGAGRWTLTHRLLAEALKRRRRTPIFVVDAGLPSDVDHAAAELEDAFIYDLDDLESVARQGQATREVATTLAWKVLGRELTNFLEERAARTAVPTITALRSHFEHLRQQVLSESRGDAEQATHVLIQRLLHDPTENIRRAVAQGDGADLEESAKKLFGLGDDELMSRRQTGVRRKSR